jgi:hypothetical protein
MLNFGKSEEKQDFVVYHNYKNTFPHGFTSTCKVNTSCSEVQHYQAFETSDVFDRVSRREIKAQVSFLVSWQIR